MRLVALVKEAESIRLFLRSIGEPTEALPMAPARAPPYRTGRVPRRQPPTIAELEPDLFGT